MSDYIPLELVQKILERLPVDDVLRCTNVCKTWYDLITSSSFISSHLKNQEPKLLIAHRTTTKISSFSLHHDNQTFDRIANLNPPQGIPRFPYYVIGNFRGLYCLYESHDHMDRILLWNPSIRKSITLYPRSRDSKTSRSAIGFCFLSEINDYKIVRCTYQWTIQGSYIVPPDVEVYELQINTWRSLDVPDFPYVIGEHSKQAVWNSILHWVVYDPDFLGHPYGSLIGSFDMKNETFSSLACPTLDWEEIFEVYTFRESICVAQCADTLLRIWVMKEYGVKDSWENQFNLETSPYTLPTSLYSRNNGDILILNSSWGQYFMTSCDPETNEITNFEVHESRIFLVDSYVESLVLIKSSNQVLKRRCEDDQVRVNKNIRIG